MQTDTHALAGALSWLTDVPTRDGCDGVDPGCLDRLVLPGQCGHQETVMPLGSSTKAHLTFPEFGNIGPASVPYTFSKMLEEGLIQSGDRVGLMGIGSGLNCSMAEVVW